MHSVSTLAARRQHPFRSERTLCGLPTALLTTLSVPLRAPVTAGVKVTLKWQVGPAAKLPPQSFVTANSALVVMLVRLSAAPRC